MVSYNFLELHQLLSIRYYNNQGHILRGFGGSGPFTNPTEIYIDLLSLWNVSEFQHYSCQHYSQVFKWFFPLHVGNSTMFHTNQACIVRINFLGGAGSSKSGSLDPKSGPFEGSQFPLSPIFGPCCKKWTFWQILGGGCTPLATGLIPTLSFTHIL